MTQLLMRHSIDDINKWLAGNDVDVIDLKVDSGIKVVTGSYANVPNEYGQNTALGHGKQYSYTNYILIYKTK